jgi:hypothetical protein
LFVTIAAESFGTNIRSTAATSIPNFVRGAVFPMSLLLMPLTQFMPYWRANLTVGILSFCLAILGTFLLKETFGKSLEYLDQ